MELLAGGTTATTVTGLADDAVYDFRVFAGSFAGYEEEGSNVVSGVQPVGRPVDLSVRGVNRDAATLDWKPPNQGINPSFYRIQYTLENVVTEIADVRHFGGSSATQSALLNPLQQAEHRVKVFSRSRSGYYDPQGTLQVTVTPIIVPTNLRVTFTDPKAVTLKWDVPADVQSAPVGLRPVGYRLKYTKAKTLDFDFSEQVGPAVSELTVSTLFLRDVQAEIAWSVAESMLCVMRASRMFMVYGRCYVLCATRKPSVHISVRT